MWELKGEGISVSRIAFKYLKLSQSQKARVGKGRWWFVLHSHTSLSSRGQLQRRPNKSLRNVFVRLCARPNPAPTASTCTKGGLYSRPRPVCVGGPAARFLCRVWQSQVSFAISPSHVGATNLQLTYCSDSRAYLFSEEYSS